MTSEPPVNQPDKTEQPRKTYTTPQLVHYGNIREITKATGGVVGMNDGGAGKDKTG
jgi:hypothetical protein